MPWLQVNDRAEEVEAVCRSKRDDNVAESRVRLNKAEDRSVSITFILSNMIRNSTY